jgi:diguanylate cyclase (GGDEF)-like protein/PAS domain S-box-containing protein
MTDLINSPAGPISAASLQQTLLEYQAILENASVGILFTRERQVLHCNPKFSEIYGWPHGELVGQPGSVFYLSEEAYAEIGRLAGPILARGEQLDHEISMRRKDGSTVYCHMRAKAINPANTAEGTIWIAEDIGERKRAQAEMQDLLIKQRAILENASLGIMFTSDGAIVHCNPRVEVLLGWPAGTLTGQKADVFFRDFEDYLAFGKAIGKKLADGVLVDIEWQNARKDGTLIWCRHMAKALTTSDGSRSTIWITEDISDKKAAQEALDIAHRELENRVVERTAELEKARQQLETMFQSSPLAIYARDMDNNVTSWNLAAERMFGWKANEIIGHPLQTVPPGQMAEADELRRRALGGEQIAQIEVVRQRRDGTPIDVSLTFAPLRDASNEVYGYQTIVAEITERKAAEQRIEFLAFHDPLTGLPNRLLMQDRFKQAAAHAERTLNQIALLYLDLDNFKNINDSLGHAAGDTLLKEVARRLSGCVRETDTICRQGGDEFLILLSDLPDTDVIPPILAKLQQQLQEPFHANGHELSSSVSIGVTLFPRDGPDFETLLQKADMAMYRAKDAGRNTFRFFDESMNVEAVEHLVMQNGLRRAIERGEFVLHYQPKVDLTTGAVIGAEALIRWNHPDLGLVPPGRFIPVAEESGLIVQMGQWVMTEACRQAVAWQHEGLPPLSIAVNLSAVQFKRSDVSQVVSQALQDSGLAPGLLELELTESILIQNIESVLITVQNLKRLGVTLSIDDFGTGYSSLSYLKRFDIDKLKIDQSFVRDLASDPDDAAIVRAIIQMAHSLSLKTIAEGVETAAALQMLHGFECDEAQGFHFARPMPADEFVKYVKQR